MADTAHVFSPTTLAFYATALRPRYEATGTWPSDGVPIPDDEVQQWWSPPPGKTRGVGPDGLPCWVDLPAPAEENKK